MSTQPTHGLLIELLYKLPNHTYKAVARRAGELEGDQRYAYLSSSLADWERAEATKEAGR